MARFVSIKMEEASHHYKSKEAGEHRHSKIAIANILVSDTDTYPTQTQTCQVCTQEKKSFFNSFVLF